MAFFLILAPRTKLPTYLLTLPTLWLNTVVIHTCTHREREIELSVFIQRPQVLLKHFFGRS